MNANPSVPLFRSNRTSLRYVFFSATSSGKIMLLKIWFVFKSMPTIFGPPKAGRTEADTTRVKHPQPVLRIYYHALDRDKTILLVPLLASVHFLIGVGDCLALLHLGNGVKHFVSPLRKVHEDTAGTGYGYPVGMGPLRRPPLRSSPPVCLSPVPSETPHGLSRPYQPEKEPLQQALHIDSCLSFPSAPLKARRIRFSGL